MAWHPADFSSWLHLCKGKLGRERSHGIEENMPRCSEESSLWSRSNWWEEGQGEPTCDRVCSTFCLTLGPGGWPYLSVTVMTHFRSFLTLVFQIIGISILCSSLIILGPYSLCPVGKNPARSRLCAAIFYSLYWGLEKRISHIEHMSQHKDGSCVPWVLGALAATPCSGQWCHFQWHQEQLTLYYYCVPIIPSMTSYWSLRTLPGSEETMLDPAQSSQSPRCRDQSMPAYIQTSST